MDPNANLAEQHELIKRYAETGKLHNYDRYDLYNLRVALRDWLRGGGFQPNWDGYAEGTAAYRKWAGAYSTSKPA